MGSRQAARVRKERWRVNLRWPSCRGGRSADDHLSPPARPLGDDVIARVDIDRAQKLVAALGEQSQQPVVQPLYPRRPRIQDLARAGDRHALAAVMPDQRLGLDARQAEELEDRPVRRSASASSERSDRDAQQDAAPAGFIRTALTERPC